jgi:diguanylate cyclase (GGDEF)-like protein
MSLIKQLFLAICIFLLVAFSGSFLVGLESSRSQMLEQLRSHAQDAATALGLSLANHVQDPTMVELMVSSIFDSGYFASIRVLSVPAGEVLAERSVTPDTGSTPAWFARLVGLQAEAGDAVVMRGWEQAARVEVVSHPQFALAKLWQSALGSFAWLALCGVLSALLGGWLLRRQLGPLEQLARHAEAISLREFPEPLPVPRTTELRRVVGAVNLMAEKLKALFTEEAQHSEQLRRQAFEDSLTGLANRRLLHTRLADDLLASEQNSPGFVMTLQLNDLAGLNQRLGGEHTDALIVAVSELLKRQLLVAGRSGWLAARNRGGEFSLLAPVLQNAEAEHLARELSAALENLRATGASDQAPVACLALVPYHPGLPMAALMQRLDQALALAQNQRHQPWAVLSEFTPAPPQSQQHWRAWLDHALQQRQLLLYLQPVASCASPQQVLHHKVLARLPDAQGQPVVAGQFLPWIERLGWAARFDLAMLERCLEYLVQQPRKLALSLCAATLSDAASLQHVLQRLRAAPGQAHLLTLEADERHLPQPAQLQALVQAIHECGYAFAVQRFGGRFSQIGNLTRLGLAYLKVDGSYIRDIDQQPDKRLFIEAIVRATHSIDLPLVAEMVESEAEFNALRDLGVAGAMGRWVGEPVG